MMSLEVGGLGLQVYLAPFAEIKGKKNTLGFENRIVCNMIYFLKSIIPRALRCSCSPGACLLGVGALLLWTVVKDSTTIGDDLHIQAPQLFRVCTGNLRKMILCNQEQQMSLQL